MHILLVYWFGHLYAMTVMMMMTVMRDGVGSSHRDSGCENLHVLNEKK